ncbi:hypothetical protein BYT27DRAFT_7193504 [Phlegmacium glaucopus]|nr:hypothetical protein BYT27DRAFT_7193504 [Phlegmacium glaucopus]
MSLLRQEPQDIASEESQENGENEAQSLDWREIAGDNIVILQDVIDEIVDNADKFPDQISEAADIISKTSSHIESLRNHEDDFKRLLGDASGLVVVFWQLYNRHNKSKSPLPWPPPKFTPVINILLETVDRIHKLMKRKSEKNPVKRTLLGHFGLRGRKFEKYQWRLDSVASFLENTPNNINIGEVLHEVVNSRTQPHQEHDIGQSTQAPDGDPLTSNGTKQNPNPVIQEPTAEASRLAKEKSTAPKPANQKVKSKDFEEGDQRESLGKQKAKNKAKDDSGDEAAQEHSTKKGTRFKGQDGDDLEDSSKKGSPTNNATRSKSMNRPSQVDDDEDNNGNTPVRDPVAPKKPAGKKAGKQKARSQSIPLSPAQSSISGFSFNNDGQGNMKNENVGNIYNSSISGVGNDYSVNHFHARRKRTTNT